MKSKEILDIARGFVRPFSQYLVVLVVLWLAVYGAIKYMDIELARYIITGVVGAGLFYLGEYAGERAGKRKEDK